MSAPLELEKAFARVKAKRLGSMRDAEIIRLMRDEQRCLCIVNTKKHARLLFQALEGLEGCFHLSAAMCPVHRSKVLGDLREPKANTIRQRLRDGESCRVVSTQLVEAGVDVDFPVVIRAIAGIDSIVQAAGRCNREGKIADGGHLFVFTPEEGLPEGHFRQSAQITELVLHGSENCILESATVRAYFKELYWVKDGSGELDSERIMPLFEAGAVDGDFPFKNVARLYRLIPDAQMPVIIPFDDRARELCEQLRENSSPGQFLRLLQPYTVQVYPGVLARLQQSGYVEGIDEGRYYILTDFGLKDAYDEHFGLNPVVKDFLEPVDLMP